MNLQDHIGKTLIAYGVNKDTLCLQFIDEPVRWYRMTNTPKMSGILDILNYPGTVSLSVPTEKGSVTMTSENFEYHWHLREVEPKRLRFLVPEIELNHLETPVTFQGISEDFTDGKWLPSPTIHRTKSLYRSVFWLKFDGSRADSNFIYLEHRWSDGNQFQWKEEFVRAVTKVQYSKPLPLKDLCQMECIGFRTRGPALYLKTMSNGAEKTMFIEPGLGDRVILREAFNVSGNFTYCSRATPIQLMSDFDVDGAWYHNCSTDLEAGILGEITLESFYFTLEYLYKNGRTHYMWKRHKNLPIYNSLPAEKMISSGAEIPIRDLDGMKVTWFNVNHETLVLGSSEKIVAIGLKCSLYSIRWTGVVPQDFLHVVACEVLDWPSSPDYFHKKTEISGKIALHTKIDDWRIDLGDERGALSRTPVQLSIGDTTFRLKCLYETCSAVSQVSWKIE